MAFPKIRSYPKVVYLKGAAYKVKFVKKIGKGDCDDVGETDPNTHEIRIKAGMSQAETMRTFIHEVLHFIEFEWPVRLKHETVYQMEAALFNFFIDNFT